MSDETPATIQERLDDLLARWEELRKGGREVSAEEVCRDDPGLAADLERRIERLRSMDWLDRHLAESSSCLGPSPAVAGPVPGLATPIPTTLGGRYHLE